MISQDSNDKIVNVMRIGNTSLSIKLILEENNKAYD